MHLGDGDREMNGLLTLSASRLRDRVLACRELEGINMDRKRPAPPMPRVGTLVCQHGTLDTMHIWSPEHWLPSSAAW